MRHVLFHRLMLSCFAFITAIAVPATSAATNAAPFRATISFTEQVGPPVDPTEHCFLIGVIEGTGVAGRLGTVELASRDCINPLSATSFLFLSDEVVLTLGSGEEIWAAYGGTLSAATGVIKGTYFIYGGTGRFVDATGVGTIDGFEALDPTSGAGQGQIQLKGTLSY